MAKAKRKQQRKRIVARSGGKTMARRIEADSPEEHFRQRLGLRIKRRRAELGLTGREVADLLKITQPIEFKREAGGIGMPIEDLYRYSKILKCRPADLVK